MQELLFFFYEDLGTIVFVFEPFRLCEAAINSSSGEVIWDAAI